MDREAENLYYLLWGILASAAASPVQLVSTCSVSLLYIIHSLPRPKYFYYPYFTEEESDTQRAQLTLPKVQYPQGPAGLTAPIPTRAPFLNWAMAPTKPRINRISNTLGESHGSLVLPVLSKP